MLMKNCIGRGEIPVVFDVNTYASNGTPALSLYSNGEGYWEPECDVSVNFPDITPAKSCIFLDASDENFGIQEWMMDNDIGYPTGRYVLGPFGTFYPEYEIDFDLVNRHLLKGASA